MDEAYAILDYLPNSFKVPGEQEYITFLWDAFNSNSEEREGLVVRHHEKCMAMRSRSMRLMSLSTRDCRAEIAAGNFLLVPFKYFVSVQGA